MKTDIKNFLGIPEKYRSSAFVGIMLILLGLIMYKYYTSYFTAAYNKNYAMLYVKNYKFIITPPNNKSLSAYLGFPSKKYRDTVLKKEKEFANQSLGMYVIDIYVLNEIDEETKKTIKKYEDSIINTQGEAALLSYKKMAFIRTRGEANDKNAQYPTALLDWFFAILFYSILKYIRKQHNATPVVEYQWLTIAVVLWILSSLASIYENLLLQYFSEASILGLKTCISTFNSLCFLLAIPHIEIQLVEDKKWLNKLIPHSYIYENNTIAPQKLQKYNHGITLIAFMLMGMILIVAYFNHNQELNSVVRGIDLMFSIPTIIMLGAIFYYAFSERTQYLLGNYHKIHTIFLITIVFSLFCTLLVQLFRIPTIELLFKYYCMAWNYSYLLALLSFSYKFSLLSLVLSLSFSGREIKLHEANHELDEANKELDKVNQELAKKTMDLKNQVELVGHSMAEMNHRVRGNLGIIIDKLELELPGSHINKEHVVFCRDLLLQSKAMYWLHNTIIAELKQQTNPELGEVKWLLSDYIREIVGHVEVVFSYKIPEKNKHIAVSGIYIKKTRFAAMLSETLINAFKYSMMHNIHLSIFMKEEWLVIKMVNTIKEDKKDKDKITMGKDILNNLINEKGGHAELNTTNPNQYDLTIYLPLSKL